MNEFNQNYINNSRAIEAIIITDSENLKEIYREFLTGPVIMKFVEITSFTDTENVKHDIIISKGIRMPEHLVNAFLVPDDIYVSMVNNNYLSKYDQVMVDGYKGFVLIKNEDLCKRDVKAGDFKPPINYAMPAPGYGYSSLTPSYYNPPYQYSPMYSSPYYNAPMTAYNPYGPNPYYNSSISPCNAKYRPIVSFDEDSKDDGQDEVDDWQE